MKNYLTQTNKKIDKLGFKTYKSYEKYLINEKFKNNERLNTRDLLHSFTKLELAWIVEHLYDKPKLITHNNFNTIIKSFINYFKDIKKENRKRINSF
tara:strand:+ start:843 stop:1133 length:291 start_codon:yes stop_codon:yes gene_type:complete